MEIRAFRSTEIGQSSYAAFEPDSDEVVAIDPACDVGQHLALAAGKLANSSQRLRPASTNNLVCVAPVSWWRRPESALGQGMTRGCAGYYDRLWGGLEVGPWMLQVLAISGHTRENLVNVLIDAAVNSQALLSGSALMLGTAAFTGPFGPEESVVLVVERELPVWSN